MSHSKIKLSIIAATLFTRPASFDAKIQIYFQGDEHLLLLKRLKRMLLDSCSKEGIPQIYFQQWIEILSFI